MSNHNLLIWKPAGFFKDSRYAIDSKVFTRSREYGPAARGLLQELDDGGASNAESATFGAQSLSTLPAAYRKSRRPGVRWQMALHAFL